MKVSVQPHAQRNAIQWSPPFRRLGTQAVLPKANRHAVCTTLTTTTTAAVTATAAAITTTTVTTTATTTYQHDHIFVLMLPSRCSPSFLCCILQQPFLSPHLFPQKRFILFPACLYHDMRTLHAIFQGCKFSKEKFNLYI
jgi:hypothetical protein